ncbi:hypothetical protein EIP91_005884 [Steccherinum ochraceum]|uniref:UBX domain-containing protein n=1 Tax=Steccherinum ochraceum TaxID=92696 RepID=A0A4R0R947_9APHY|nr:hypothetical protein EIP91_005884 [Steccherinum ochraceum]
MDLDTLSPSQRQALSQLQAVTNGGDTEVAIGVLDSVGWDVQRAADVIFDSNPSAPLPVPRTSTDTTPSNMERFEVDDTEQDGLLGGRPNRPRQPSHSTNIAALSRPLRFLLAILTFPFHVLRTFFRMLRIPLPQLPMTLSSLTIYYRNPLGPRNDLKLDARGVAERWVRALEEETGAVRLSRRAVSSEGASSSVGSSGSAAGMTARKQAGEEGERILSDFFLGSYEEFAKACAREDNPKLGCVILVSEEHDDVAEFKRSTLADSLLVRLMHDNDFLVWGGDVRDRDAWSAAQKLQATTYPFVAFIGLQPRRGGSSTSSTTSPVLTVLSRHQGPSIPTATAPTSAPTLVQHLNESVLPRVSPYLIRVRNQAAERATQKALDAERRDRERALRAEQDRAFEESKRRDKERIERKVAEERKARAEAVRAAEEKARDEAARERQELEQQQWEVKRMEWRRWGRRGLVPREPRPGNVEPARGKTLRVGVRMPDGKRGVRFFGEGDSVTAVYAYVDTLLIPEGREWSSDMDPVSPPDGKVTGEEGLMQAMREAGKEGDSWWGFNLVLSYPRREIRWEAGKKLGEIEGLKAGGQLAVEMLDTPVVKGKGKERATSSGSDDDGYVTEESD